MPIVEWRKAKKGLAVTLTFPTVGSAMDWLTQHEIVTFESAVNQVIRSERLTMADFRKEFTWLRKQIERWRKK